MLPARSPRFSGGLYWSNGDFFSGRPPLRNLLRGPPKRNRAARLGRHPEFPHHLFARVPETSLRLSVNNPPMLVCPERPASGRDLLMLPLSAHAFADAT